MSHTVHIDVELSDEECLKKACNRCGAIFKTNDEVTFYDGSVRTGLSVKLKGWKYPIVLNDSNVYMDDYASWSCMDTFYELKTYYGIEKVKKLARIKGYTSKEVMVNNKPQVKIFVRN